MKRSTLLPPLAALLMLSLGCHSGEKAAGAGGGNVDAGKAAVEKYGCNACHIVPGIEGPRGMAGPSLEHLKSRPLLAGKLPNNPEMLAKWVQNPPAYNPQNAMPNVGVTPQDAKDIAAYPYTQP